MIWMLLLELNDISLQQGGFSLQVPQLELRSGQLYVLKGENGSGKSTLLRLLALLQPPTSGRVSFAGLSVAWRGQSLKQLRQRITLLEQNPLLFSGSVEKNLAFGLKLRGSSGRELQQRIAQTLDIVGLNGFQKRSAKELSGGETRRVALARALCLQPQLLLLDEPTANLDAGQVAALEKFLVALPQQGMTLVIASHDSGQSKRLGGKIISLANGRLILNGGEAPVATRKPELKVV
jgi:tungstate transport system ATP-binding protein